MANHALEITPSSGNVFLDLGFPPVEAANLLLRSTLMGRITRIAREGGRTPAQAAKLLGTTQRRLAALRKGRVDAFDLETLVSMLARAGYVLEMNFSKDGGASAH